MILETRHVNCVLQRLKIIGAVSFSIPHSIRLAVRKGRGHVAYTSAILRSAGKFPRSVMADAVLD
jgi:hypothetical protein